MSPWCHQPLIPMTLTPFMHNHQELGNYSDIKAQDTNAIAIWIEDEWLKQSSYRFTKSPESQWKSLEITEMDVRVDDDGHGGSRCPCLRSRVIECRTTILWRWAQARYFGMKLHEMSETQSPQKITLATSIISISKSRYLWNLFRYYTTLRVSIFIELTPNFS